MPAVITEFMRSYTRAMRSNIARTCVSGRVPEAGALPLIPAAGRPRAALVLALERRDVLDELVELLGVLLAQRGERGHRRRRVDQRSRDRVLAEPGTDLGQVG